MSKKYFIGLLLVIVILLYILAGVLLNPMIIWVAGPIYIAYLLFNSGEKTNNQGKYYAAYGYLIGSAGFSFFYHFAWFFDWDGTKTGGSTSALIFAVFPIYAVIIGSVFGLIGYSIRCLFERNDQENS